MYSVAEQDLQIVRAFSSVDVPEKIIRESNIKDLIHSMVAERDSVQSDTQRLERLRQEKKEGNFFGNWWEDRDDKVQDAQIDLNKSIGRLTQKSSQLLIVNTAISKVLSDQQRILLQQQNILKQQTDDLESQNRKILDQQKQLEQQQMGINAANQGLMEAKGITQEQAQKLVGCVMRVTEAEKKIDVANQELRFALEQHLHDSIAQLNAGFTELYQRHDEFEQQLSNELLAQSQYTQGELERFASSSAEFKAGVEQQLSNELLAQSQHTQGELERFASSSAEFKSGVEQQLSNELLAQSQHTQGELERFASSSAEFKSGVEQQMQAHIQTVLEKTTNQDAAAQQLRESLSMKLEKFQEAMDSAVRQEMLALRETVKSVAHKQESAQQEQTQALDAQRESLEHNLQHLSVDLSSRAEALKNAEAQLENLQAEQQKIAGSNRLALAAVACVALASLGWQVAQHFTVI